MKKLLFTILLCSYVSSSYSMGSSDFFSFKKTDQNLEQTVFKVSDEKSKMFTYLSYALKAGLGVWGVYRLCLNSDSLEGFLTQAVITSACWDCLSKLEKLDNVVDMVLVQ